MNNKHFLIALSVVAFSSCSTIYKSGQTPDDVYFSPTRLEEENIRIERERPDEFQSFNNDTRLIRMGFNDRRWRNFDNDFFYNPYLLGHNYGYFYDPFYNNFPIFNPIILGTPIPRISTPRSTNLGAYGNGYLNTNAPSSPKTKGLITQPVRNYQNNSSKLGGTLKKIFNNDAPSYNNRNNNIYNNNNSNTQNNRSYSPSSSGSRNSGSSSGRPISRPARTGN